MATTGPEQMYVTRSLKNGLALRSCFEAVEQGQSGGQSASQPPDGACALQPCVCVLTL